MEALLKAPAGLIKALNGQIGIIFSFVLGPLSSVLTAPARDWLFGLRAVTTFRVIDKQG
jgi:hypothetical protein